MIKGTLTTVHSAKYVNRALKIVMPGLSSSKSQKPGKYSHTTNCAWHIKKAAARKQAPDKYPKFIFVTFDWPYAKDILAFSPSFNRRPRTDIPQSE
jgi:hypothetical protein